MLSRFVRWFKSLFRPHRKSVQDVTVSNKKLIEAMRGGK